MSEVAVQIFQEANEFWQHTDHSALSELAINHIDATLDYARKNPDEVGLRAEQVDVAISLFNQQREAGVFAPDAFNAKKLDEPLPFLEDLPNDLQSRNSFFEGFLKLVRHQYYTFLDKPDSFDPKILITGLLVDGYSFALRSKRAVEHKPTLGKDDLIICNVICEMVPPGILQEEMVKANWYKPDNGLDPEFCKQIKKQYAK